MIPRVLWLWWVAMLGPSVTGDGKATAVGSQQYAHMQAQFACGRELEAACTERGLGRVLEVNYGDEECEHEVDMRGIWFTCAVTCSGECSEREVE